ncbi:PIN-like domain-containing protein [Gilvimarinus algae]|uniref:PIN-like domain-containing protein n=1 Tax=Gilvimarinus algae TaxID=3058037 RepID=A0ABT8TFZ1_9GAMM|nr:PIN-like domain-containing protein [Gilvimarinus sp. SDUM040014]MDO3381596.1 PIN-like domain-containing protein [Gilvimarinus sp. SDUM040014]
MLETLLKIHRDSSELDFQEIWKNATFVFDANVLLDFYRLPQKSKDALIKILKSKEIKNRIWIPNQVFIEFLNNRVDEIGDQKQKFSKVREQIEKSLEEYDDVFERLAQELNKLQLKKRHSLINPDKFLIKEDTDKGKHSLNKFLEELNRLDKLQPDVNDEDQIKKNIIDIFYDKIGDGFSKEEIDEIYFEGKIRYENRVPPGYKDSDKSGVYSIGKIEYLRKYGDLVVWKEILRKINQDEITNFLFITSDLKDDWWRKSKGKTLGPRRELLNEVYTCCESLQNFYMYDTANFLKYSEQYLGLDIEKKSIDETMDFMNAKRTVYYKKRKKDSVRISNILNDIQINSAGVKLGVGESIMALPPLDLKHSQVYSIINSIIVVLSEFGPSSYISCQSNYGEKSLKLRFRNSYMSKNRKISFENYFDRKVSISDIQDNLTPVMEKAKDNNMSLKVGGSSRSVTVTLYLFPNSHLTYSWEESNLQFNDD